MHDAVRVVHRDGAVLPQTLPLERRAERADLVLLVLLLLGELHEHLRDTETEDRKTLRRSQSLRAAALIGSAV